MEDSSSARARVVWMVALMAVMVAGLAMVGVSGQSCISDLAICNPAITNSSMKPSTECCNSLKKAVKNELRCLCSIYGNPTFFKTANLNKTRAFEVPRLCSINDDFSQCTSAASPASSSPPSAPATPSVAPPPTTSGSADRRGAASFTWGRKVWWVVGFWCASFVLL